MALFSLLRHYVLVYIVKVKKMPVSGVKSVKPVNILASKHYPFIIAMIADG